MSGFSRGIKLIQWSLLGWPSLGVTLRETPVYWIAKNPESIQCKKSNASEQKETNEDQRCRPGTIMRRQELSGEWLVLSPHWQFEDAE